MISFPALLIIFNYKNIHGHNRFAFQPRLDNDLVLKYRFFPYIHKLTFNFTH